MLNLCFDTANKVEEPTFVLAYKSGEKIGKLTNVTDVHIKNSMNDAPSITFKVNGSDTPFWNQITTFKLVWYKEEDEWYESVVDLNQDSEGTYKVITLTRLGESELNNINVYGLEVNTESDIDREDYFPTVLYNPDDTSHSLLNRILSHAPHYGIGHVDNTIKNIQRIYSMNDKPVWTCLKEVADDENVLFIPKNRLINAYDLLSNCSDCGYRGRYTKICPKCNSTNIVEGYGKNTGICVSKDSLGSSITVADNTDDIKNCMHLSGGDDDMTAAIRNCNPNGTGYMWAFTNETMSEMSPSLISKYAEYTDDYKSAMSDVISFDATDYNNLVDKYNGAPYNNNFEKINTINGFPDLIKSWYDSIDFGLYLKTSLMPSIDNDDTTAQDVADTLTSEALSPVAIGNLDNISLSVASQAVLNAAKLVANPHYEVTVFSSDSFPSLNSNVWQGYLQVKNYYDESGDDKAVTELLTVTVNDDYESYVSQKVKKALYNYTEGNTGAAGMFAKTLDQVEEELKLYSLDELLSINQAFQGAIDILTEQKIDDPERLSPEFTSLYEDIYVPVVQKKEAVESEIAIRDAEVDIINSAEEILVTKKNEIQTELNLENYLGSSLWVELNAFRREESFSDDNYISDDLDSAELIARAYEFVQLAEQKISERNQYSYQINSSMQNLLLIPEFSGLKSDFEIGNWIRIKTDNDELYKLRLVDYEMDFGSPESLTVTFSDISNTSNIRTIQSIISNADDLIKNRKKYVNENKKRFTELTDDARADSVKNNNITNDILWDSLDSTNLNIIKASDKFESEIKVTERELSSKFAQYSGSWIIPEGMIVKYYGYGNEDRPTNPEVNDIYVDQETGIAWKWNGTNWIADQTLEKLTDTMQSAINQNAQAITTKVSSTDYNGNEIASKINQTATTIQIEANKINLNGYVTVNDLSGSGTTTINGDNITTGKIKSSNFVDGRDGFSTTGTEINLNTGAIKAPGFTMNGQSGDAKFSGTVYMKEGYIGDSPILSAGSGSDTELTLEHSHNTWKLRSAPLNDTSLVQTIISTGKSSYPLEIPEHDEDEFPEVQKVFVDDIQAFEGAYNDYIIHDNNIIFMTGRIPSSGSQIDIEYEYRYYTYLTAAKNFVVSDEKDGGHSFDNDVTGECSIGSVTYPWSAGFFKKLTVGYRDLNWTQIVRNLGFRLLAEPKVNLEIEGTQVKITCEDPSDITTNKPVPATWAGTAIVKSEGQPAPWNRYQGNVIAEWTNEAGERNIYSEEPFVDNCEKGKRYFYGIFPYDTNGYTQFSTILEADFRVKNTGSIGWLQLLNMNQILDAIYTSSETRLPMNYIEIGYDHTNPRSFASGDRDLNICSVKYESNPDTIDAIVYANSSSVYSTCYIELPSDTTIYAPESISNTGDYLSTSGGPVSFDIRIESMFNMDYSRTTNMYNAFPYVYFSNKDMGDNIMNNLKDVELPCGDNVINMANAYYYFMPYTTWDYDEQKYKPYMSFSPVCGNSVVNMYGAYTYSNGIAGKAACGPNVQDLYYAYAWCGFINEAACGDNVINMSYSYYYCNNINGSPVCGKNVVNMSRAYMECRKLTGSPVCGANVADMSYAYEYCSNLTGSPIIGDNVTNIEGAYMYCSNLTGSAYIPENITSAYYTYYYCSNLTQAVCPDNIQSLEYTYAGCSNIKTPVVGRNVVYMDFSYASSGVNISVCGENVKYMNSTYSGCLNLITPICGENVIDMNGAYSCCYNLTTTVCGEKVQYMNNTYSYCNHITTPVCGNNVIYMCRAYYNCTNLTTAVCGPNVSDMYQTYYGCINITDAVCGENVRNMYYAYAWCNNLVNIVCGKYVSNTSYAYSYCNSINRAADIDHKPAEGFYGMYYKSNINTLIWYNWTNDTTMSWWLPDNSDMLKIYNGVTANYVEFPDGIKTLRNIFSVQYYSSGTSYLPITVKHAGCPDSVTEMYSTYAWSKVETAACGNNVKTMHSAYRGCARLTDAVCGPNVTTMERAYQDCICLKNAACGKNVLNMAFAYYNCQNLINASCGDKVTNMWSTYLNCYNLTTAVCGPNVTTMYQTYAYCNNLTTAACGDKVTDMQLAYVNCTSLITPVCGSNVIYMSGSYRNCCNLSSIVFGDNVRYMSKAYANCYNAFNGYSIDLTLPVNAGFDTYGTGYTSYIDNATPYAFANLKDGESITIHANNKAQAELVTDSTFFGGVRHTEWQSLENRYEYGSSKKLIVTY